MCCTVSREANAAQAKDDSLVDLLSRLVNGALLGHPRIGRIVHALGRGTKQLQEVCFYHTCCADVHIGQLQKSRRRRSQPHHV